MVTADVAAGKKFAYTVVTADAEKDGKQKCKPLGDTTHLVSWTLSGWDKPADAKKDADAAASGAKTLAAAFTAGALAVAATQF